MAVQSDQRTQSGHIDPSQRSQIEEDFVALGTADLVHLCLKGWNGRMVEFAGHSQHAELLMSRKFDCQRRIHPAVN